MDITYDGYDLDADGGDAFSYALTGGNATARDGATALFRVDGDGAGTGTLYCDVDDLYTYMGVFEIEITVGECCCPVRLTA